MPYLKIQNSNTNTKKIFLHDPNNTIQSIQYELTNTQNTMTNLEMLKILKNDIQIIHT